VSKIQYTRCLNIFKLNPPMYKINDYNNDEIAGTFYEQELQKINQEVYRIEKK